MTATVNQRCCQELRGSVPRCRPKSLKRGVPKDVVQRLGEDRRQGRNGGGADDAELDPAPEEAGQPAVAFAEEDVVAAGPRVEDGHLGEASAPSRARRPPSDPDERRQPEIRDVVRD